MKTMEENLGDGANHVGKNCLFCNKELSENQAKRGRKFCSQRCYWNSKVGEKHSWGDKISKALKGKPKSPEHIENSRQALIGRTRPEISEEKNCNWKGDDVGYSALHDWVWKYKGAPEKCEHCGRAQERVNGTSCVHWANISGEYKRDLEDWIGLCRRCHYIYDQK